MTDGELDIASNRASRKYSTSEWMRRVLWGIGALVFRWTPRLLYGVRNALLRLFGADIGTKVRIHPTATIYFPWNLTIGDWSSIGEEVFLYNLGPITIGEKVTVSHRAHLCAGTHDASDPTMPLQKPPITIGDQAWICADAFIGPGVTVGNRAVVGARAVAVKNVESGVVVGGNPARPLKEREIRFRTSRREEPPRNASRSDQ